MTRAALRRAVVSPPPRPSTSWVEVGELSGSPWETCKVWFALRNLGVTPLLGLLAQVVEQRRAPAQLLDAGQTIARRVHPRLDHPQCERAVLEHLARPGQGLLFEPLQ